MGISMGRACIVLAGGAGTRVAHITGGSAKCMLPIHGIPFIQIMLQSYVAQMIDDFILCLGVGAGQVIDHIESCADLAPKCRFIVDSERRGTLTPVLEAFSTYSLNEALVCNGDTFQYGSIADVAKAGVGAGWGADVVVGLSQVEECGRYGAVEVDGEIVRSLATGHSGTGLASAGIIKINRRIFDYLKPSMTSFDLDLVAEICRSGRVRSILLDKGFVDIGTEEGYREFERTYG